jgi:hypothetical protein
VNHILSLYGAKVAAFARNDAEFEIRLDREEANHAVYIDTSEPGVSNISGPQYEQRYPSTTLTLFCYCPCVLVLVRGFLLSSLVVF